MDTLSIIYSSKSLNNMQSLNNKKRPGKEKGIVAMHTLKVVTQ